MIETIIAARPLSLEAGESYRGPIVTIPAKSSALVVRIPRPTSINGIIWDGVIDIALVVELDSEEFRASFSASGGILEIPKRYGSGEIEHFTGRWNLPVGFFGADEGVDPKDYATVKPKRFGETSKQSFRAWVEVSSKGGPVASEIEVVGEVEDAPAWEFHHSIAYDTQTSVSEEGGDGAVSVSFTAGAGSNRAALVVYGDNRDGASSGHTVTYAGSAPFSTAWDVANTYDRCTGSVFLDATIGSGAKTVAGSPTGGSGTRWAAMLGVMTLSGVDQTTPVGTAATSAADSGAVSVTVGSINATDMVLDGWVITISTQTVGADQTERLNVESGSNHEFLCCSSQPGTSGGVMSWARSADTWDYAGGAVAFKEAGSGNITVTPGTLALSLTTFAPTVFSALPGAGYFGHRYFGSRFFGPRYFGGVPVAAGNVTVTPGTASLTLASFAPQLQEQIPVGVASLATTAFAPQLREVLTVGALSLALTTFEPTAGLGPFTATPDPASLVLTSFAPQLQEVIPVGLASLTLSAFAPQLQEQLTVATAALLLSTFAPQLQESIPVGTAALLLTAFAPVLTETIPIGVASLLLTTFEPTADVSADQTATPDVVSLVLATFAPQLQETLTPGTLALLLNAFAPTVTIGSIVTPGVASLALSAFAPQLQEKLTVGNASLALQTFAPQLQESIPVGAAALSLSAFAPQLQERLTPGPAALTLSTFAPSLVSNQNIVPGTASLALTRFAPQLREMLTPGTANLVLTTFPPDPIDSGGHKTIVPFPATLVIVTFAPDVIYSPPVFNPAGIWLPRRGVFLHQIEQKLVRDRSRE